MSIRISRDLTLETDGNVSGLPCGTRVSGLTVARQGEAPKVHLVLPERMRFAPALFDLAAGYAEAVRTKSDGRILVDPSQVDATAVIARIEAACERGRGGIPDGQHGVYDIGQSTEGWHYVVQTTPSGRASLKKIATWTGISGRFTVPYSEGGALAAILERAVTAKVKGETTKISLPEVPGVAVRIEGGEILICPAREDNDAIRAVPSTRWDPARGAYAVSTKYSKRVAKALEEIKARVEERALKAAEAAAAKRAEAERYAADTPRINALLVEALSGFPHRIQGRSVHVRFAYDDEAVAHARAMPGAQWESYSKSWVTTAKTEADVAKIVAAVTAILGRMNHVRLLEQRDAAEREEVRRKEAAESVAKGIGSFVSYAHRAPAIGSVIMVDGRARFVTSLGRVFVADDETSSLGGPVGAEGERLRDVHYRYAADEEAEPFLAEYAAERARTKVANAVIDMRARVMRDGEAPDLGREPEGEVLSSDDTHAIRGLRTWLVLDAEAGLWAMSYDGGDGSLWGMRNCGYCVSGRRLQLTPDEIADLRRNIEEAR